MTRWTEADLAAHYAKKSTNDICAAIAKKHGLDKIIKPVRPVKEPLSSCWRKILDTPGISEKPKPGKMNRWEEEHARGLFGRLMAEEISGYYFERFRFEIAHRCLYIPDFVLLENDGGFSVDEIKGFRRDDAMVKIKVAARMYPHIPFRLWEKKSGEWVCTEVAR